MIKITKGSEPKAWIEHRNTPGAEYEAIPELRSALLHEQGFICAYCMSRIEEKESRIEHLKCRSRYPKLQMDYHNMVICCRGENDKGLHCDKSKADLDISFTPFNEDFIKSISYQTNNGKIKSSVAKWNDEINNMLVLNNKRIVQSRKQVIEGIIAAIKKKGYNRSSLESVLNKWQFRDKYGMMKAYCGVVIWYINKKNQYEINPFLA